MSLYQSLYLFISFICLINTFEILRLSFKRHVHSLLSHLKLLATFLTLLELLWLTLIKVCLVGL